MNGVFQTLTELQWVILVLSALLLFLYGLEHFSKELQTVGGDRLPRWLGLATQNRFRGLMLGAGVTAQVQSSSVVSGLAIVLVQSQVLEPHAAVAIVVGASLGTTATALIASLPMGAAARRTAQMNLLFNATGLVLIWPFIGWFSAWAIGISNSPDQAVAIANLAFNGAVALLFLPFTPWMARRFSPFPLEHHGGS